MDRSRSNAIASMTMIAALFLSLLMTTASGRPYSGHLHSLGPAEGYPGAVAVWLYFDYPMSIDCSPPRACYAKSQWIHAYVSCFTRSVAVLQQISMDLNGNVVAVANSDVPRFVRGYGRRARYALPGAAGRVLERICGDFPEPV